MFYAARMLSGVAALLAIYAAVFALYVIVPGRWVDGYVTDDAGRVLRYRLNGLRVLVVVAAAWVALGASGALAWDFLYEVRWSLAITAVVVGLVFTFAIVLPAPPTGRGLGADLYLGRWKNPQAWSARVDAKMFLYLVGAVMLELILLASAAHHVLAHRDDVSPGVILYVALFSFFLCEYLFFERVHLYTYDFVAERVGFKLGWGCLAFYPFFYGIGLWWAASQPNPHSPAWWLAGSAAIFFAGWTLARGANLQKFIFKTEPSRERFGPLPQRALHAGERRVLVGGFWGLSRHINYLGELLMATGLTLSLGYPSAIWPWLYPLYYVALLVPRQLDDDRRCAAKYGPLWDEYTRTVRWRIVPWLY
jgi:protein-S-isoprenylcysteine O-methyltransferase Ste14